MTIRHLSTSDVGHVVVLLLDVVKDHLVSCDDLVESLHANVEHWRVGVCCVEDLLDAFQALHEHVELAEDVALAAHINTYH